VPFSHCSAQSDITDYDFTLTKSSADEHERFPLITPSGANDSLGLVIPGSSTKGVTQYEKLSVGTNIASPLELEESADQHQQS